MLVQGILLGFSLSFLIGPLLFAVVQAGIGQGFRAGIAVASGIWLSDLLFVGAILWGVEMLSAMTAWSGFRFWASVLGGGLLVGFGASSFFAKNKAPEGMENAVRRSYFKWWLRGFLINTINPGTLFFWLGIVSAVVAPNHWSMAQSLTFFAGMLGTLVLTDTLKAWAAKRIRQFLTPRHITQIQKTIGLILMVFGLVLIAKAFLSNN